MNHLNAMLLGAVCLVSGTAAAGEAAIKDRQAQTCRAARALMDAQLEEGWAWQRGSEKPALNASGLVASALAQTAETCGSIDAVERFAKAALTRHEEQEFLYDPDIEALALAARLTRNPRYAEVAREAFLRRYEYANGDEIVERWFMLKRDPRLIGFEAAGAIRAALAVGETDKAVEIAQAAARTAPRWSEGWDPKGWGTTSRGAMLEALSMLPSRALTSRALAALRRDLIHHLVLTQASDGSWEHRNTQATAYAVRGLSVSGEETGITGAQLGQRWLQSTQLRDGAWATFHDHLPEPFVGEVIHEVTAEVLLALR